MAKRYHTMPIHDLTRIAFRLYPLPCSPIADESPSSWLIMFGARHGADEVQRIINCAQMGDLNGTEIPCGFARQQCQNSGLPMAKKYNGLDCLVLGCAEYGLSGVVCELGY